METMEKTEKRTHHGHSVRRIRTSQGKKQITLGLEMGLSQQTISEYEQKRVIEDDMLEKFAKALKVPVETIKELEEDPITVIFENNNNVFGDNEKINQGYFVEDNSTNHYNPVEEIVDLCKELLNVFRENNALLGNFLNKEK